MKREDLEVGMVVALRRPRADRERAIVLDLTPGWSREGVRRPWTAWTDPADAAMTTATARVMMRPRYVDGTAQPRSLVRWGDRFQIGPKRNQNVAVAVDIRRRTEGGYSTEHVFWEPTIVPLAQIEQPWVTWETTLTRQAEIDRERNEAMWERKAQRKRQWEKDIQPVLRRVFPDTHTFIDRLGMDYVEMNPTTQRFHQFPAPLLETMCERIVQLEDQIEEMRRALAP